MPKRKSNPVHQYMLFDAASDTSKCLVEGCPSTMKGNHGTNLLRHFLAHHPEIYLKIIEKNNQIKAIKEKLSMSSTLTSSDISTLKEMPSNFGVVRKACIDLVRNHGLPVSLFDCTAFKEILNVINMKRHERARISSKRIKKALATQSDETMDNDEDGSSDIEKENELDDLEIEIYKDEETPTSKSKIKSEAADSIQCTCNADGTSKHSPDCAAVCQQEYYNHFDVSVDEATCLICRKTIKWTNILQMKLHLISEHPGMSYKDDDEAFETTRTAAGSSVSSNEDTEEVYLNDDLITVVTKTPPEPPKKRKKPEFSLKDPIGPNDRTQEVEIKVSEEMGQSLDRFGLYIASLLKFLPKSRRIKCQSQIVQRLLQEQSSSAA